MKQGGGSKRRWVFVLLYYNAELAFHWKAKRWQAIQRVLHSSWYHYRGKQREVMQKYPQKAEEHH